MVIGPPAELKPGGSDDLQIRGKAAKLGVI